MSELNRYPLSQNPSLNFYLIYTTHLTYYNTHLFFIYEVKKCLIFAVSQDGSVTAYTYTAWTASVDVQALLKHLEFNVFKMFPL